MVVQKALVFHLHASLHISSTHILLYLVKAINGIGNVHLGWIGTTTHAIILLDEGI